MTGKVAALNRFVSRATNMCMPFFKVLKKVFQWNDKCEEAFAKLKEYLMKPPLLSPLVIGEKLFLYLAVSNTTVSSALIKEEGNVQPGIPRSRGKLSKDGKDSFHIVGCFRKASSLFPSTPHRRHNKPTHKKDNDQDRCSKTTHSMGN